MSEQNNNSLICNFCGKDQYQVKRLIEGTDSHICNNCIERCCDILDLKIQKMFPLKAVQNKPSKVLQPTTSSKVQDLGAKRREREKENTPQDMMPKPHQIKSFLDDYVVGQKAAKKKLSVAVYSHYRRLEYLRRPSFQNQVELSKSNVLLIGPTGTGKTLLAQTLARNLEVPFVIVDATSLTEAGYVGEDVENMLWRLYQAADEDISKAERGIIYIDEIDKIARKAESRSVGRDVSGEGVQQALLKIIEGTTAYVAPKGGGKTPQSDLIPIDTTNILFVCGGAFVGIEEHITKRIFASPRLRKSTKESKRGQKEFLNVHPDDLIQFGLIPEFVGRIPVIAMLQALDLDAFVRILTEPKNSLVRQYQTMLSFEGVELQFTPGALESIAQQAMEYNTGVRALRSIMEELMFDVLFEVPQRPDLQKIVITREIAEGEAEIFEDDD